MLTNANIGETLGRDGYALVRGVLCADRIAGLIDALSALRADATRRRGAATYAVRHLAARVPAVAALARSPDLIGLIAPHLGPEPRLVRSLLFDKTPGANWKVAWHQDTTIAVRRRADVPGFGPWSVKEGVPHVRPPAAVLERMLTVRLHLDPCPRENGALRVIPGSHCHGILPADAIAGWRTAADPVTCAAAAGDALLMRPLLPHASSPSTAAGAAHRRVIHLEYAADDLPAGLEWYD